MSHRAVLLCMLVVVVPACRRTPEPAPTPVVYASQGGARPPIYDPIWDAYSTINIDPQNGNDQASNLGGSCGSTAIKHWSELYYGRWGCGPGPTRGCPRHKKGSTITINWCSAHTDNTDPVYYWPRLENNTSVLFQPSSLTPVWTGAIGADLKNWTFATNTVMGSMTFPVAPTQGQFILNTTHASNSMVWRPVPGDTSQSFFFAQPVNAVTLPYNAYILGTGSTAIMGRNTSWSAASGGDAISGYNLPRINFVTLGADVVDDPNGTTGVYVNELGVLEPNTISVFNSSVIDELIVGPSTNLTNVSSDRQITFKMEGAAKASSLQNVYAQRFVGGYPSGAQGSGAFNGAQGGGGVLVNAGIPCWNNFCSWNGGGPALFLDGNALLEDFDFGGNVSYGLVCEDQGSNSHFNAGQHLLTGLATGNGRIWSTSSNPDGGVLLSNGGANGTNFFISAGARVSLGAVTRVFSGVAGAMSGLVTMRLCGQTTACTGSGSLTYVPPEICGLSLGGITSATLTDGGVSPALLNLDGTTTALPGTVTLTNGSTTATASTIETLTQGNWITATVDQPNVYYEIQGPSSNGTTFTITPPYSGTGGSGLNWAQVTGFKSALVDAGSSIIAAHGNCGASVDNTQSQ